MKALLAAGFALSLITPCAAQDPPSLKELAQDEGLPLDLSQNLDEVFDGTKGKKKTWDYHGLLPVDRGGVGRGYAIPSDDAQVLDEGASKIQVHANSANYLYFNQDPNYKLLQNYETESLALGLRHGFRFASLPTEIGAQIKFHHNSQGIMDDFIVNVEKLFNRLNDNRKEEAGMVYRLEKNGKVLFSDDAKGTGIGDILLTVKTQITQEDLDKWIPAIAARIAVNLSTGRDIFSEGNYGGVGLSFSKTLKDWLVMHWDLRATVPFEGHAAVGMPLRTVGFGHTAALEFRPSDRFSITAQIDGNVSPYERTGFEAFEGNYAGYSLGFGYRMPNALIQVYGRENFEAFPFKMGHNSDPDFAFGLVLTYFLPK